jgi:hypothetical protein
VALTVTAAQSGSGASDGIALTVKVLTGAAASPAGATAQSGTVTTPELAITPDATGSLVYGALVNGASATAFTAAAGTTFTQNQTWAGDATTFATFRGTSTTTSGTPVTLGATAPTETAGRLQIALLEILASGTLAEDPSSPAVAYTNTATSVPTASFSPPAGSLLVAMVASDCSGTAGQSMTMTVSDSSGLTWTQWVTADVTAGTGTFQVASVWTAQVPPVLTAAAARAVTMLARAGATRIQHAQATVPAAAAVTALAGARGDPGEAAVITAGAAQGHSARVSAVTAARITAGATRVRTAGAAIAVTAGADIQDLGQATVTVAAVVTAAAQVVTEPALVHGEAGSVSKAGDTMTGPLTVEAPITATQAVTSGAVVIPWAATITPDATLGGHFRVTLAGATTIDAPAGPVDGQKITLELAQDATGGRVVTWGAGFAFGAAGTPALDTAPGLRAVAGFAYSASKNAWLFAGATQGFT